MEVMYVRIHKRRFLGKKQTTIDESKFNLNSLIQIQQEVLVILIIKTRNYLQNKIKGYKYISVYILNILMLTTLYRNNLPKLVIYKNGHYQLDDTFVIFVLFHE